MDYPVAILPIACRRPSTLSLTFTSGPFGLLRGLMDERDAICFGIRAPSKVTSFPKELSADVGALRGTANNLAAS